MSKPGKLFDLRQPKRPEQDYQSPAFLPYNVSYAPKGHTHYVGEYFDNADDCESRAIFIAANRLAEPGCWIYASEEGTDNVLYEGQAV